MELGADGVLMNTAIAEAEDAEKMARAMKPAACKNASTPARAVPWRAWWADRSMHVTLRDIVDGYFP